MKRIRSGILYMLASGFSFSIMGVFVKLATRTLPPLEVVFARSLAGFLLITGYIFVKKVPFFGAKKNRPILILRGTFGFLALSCFFYTIAHLDLATSVLLNQMAPLFVMLFAVIFLKEKLTARLFLYALLAFVGVYFLIRPTPNQPIQWVHLIGIISAIFAAIAFISIRAIKTNESPLTVIFYFVSIATIGSSFYLLIDARWPNSFEWLYLLGVGFGSFFGQLWLTVAFRRAPATIVTPYSYSCALLAFLFGLMIFGEILTPAGLIGGLLVVISGILISRHH